MKIDIGCGAWKRPGYIGLDLEPQPGIEIVGDAQNLPFRDEVFEEVHSDQTYEHLGNPLKALLESRRVLKMGFPLIISIPNIMNLRRFIRWMIRGKTSVSPEHIFSWGLPELKFFALVGGFDYFEHLFETHDRYHKHGWIEMILKKSFPQIIEKNLMVKFV